MDNPPFSGDRSDTDEAALLAAIQAARQLRRDDELESSQAQLLALMEEYPDHPLVLFEVGGSYDVMGEVEMAIPYYLSLIHIYCLASPRSQ